MPKLRKPQKKSPDFGNWAQRASAIIAAFALLGAAVQVMNSNGMSRRATARALYQSYFDKSFANPKYATPDFEALRANFDDWERYKMYVSHMIWAYDEIFEEEDSPEWRKAFEGDLSAHAIRICTMPRDDLLGIFSKRIDQFFRERYLPKCDERVSEQYRGKTID